MGSSYWILSKYIIVGFDNDLDFRKHFSFVSSCVGCWHEQADLERRIESSGAFRLEALSHGHIKLRVLQQ